MSSILDKISHQKSSSKETALHPVYLALDISPDTVKAAVWRIADHKLEVVNYGSTQPWRQGGVEQLILASDTTLSEASVGLDQEPDQVIFGLADTWVNQNRIVEPRRSDLKTLTQKLGLKPLGFVVTYEALNHYLKVTEGVPPSVVLLNLSDTEVIVSIINHGNLEGSQVVGRSDSLSLDVHEGLNRFPVTNHYPPRILLWDGGKELKNAQQELMNFNWTKKSKFLHFPKISVMPASVSITGVCLAGATELAKAQGIPLENTLITTERENAQPIISQSKTFPADSPPVDSSNFSKPATSTESDYSVIDKTSPQSTAAIIDSVSSHAKQLGFSTDTLSSKPPSLSNQPSVPPPPVEPPGPPTNPAPPPEGEPSNDNPPSSPISARFSWVADLKSKLIAFSTRLPIRRQSISVPTEYRLTSRWYDKLLRLGLILGLGLIILTLILGWLWWYIPKLDVIVLISPKSVEEEFVITIDPDSTLPNLDKLTIPVAKINQDKSGSVIIKTSGVGTVGDPAKGKIIIYNKAKNKKTFETGTELVSDNGLKFTLDTSITVASASSQFDDEMVETITPGKSEADITAVAIGPDSNLKASQEFVFTDYSASAYVAKNPEALSGGTAEEVPTVSVKDLIKAKQKLTEQLLAQAEAELSTESGDKKLIRDSITQNITSETASAKVGDEAKELTVKMAISLTGLAYNEADMISLAQSVIAAKTPAGYTVDSNSFEFDLKTQDSKQPTDNQFLAVVKVNLIPDLNTEKIIGDIVGKKPDLVGMYLHNMPSVTGVKLNYWPKLPINLPPQRAENITITTKIQ